MSYLLWCKEDLHYTPIGTLMRLCFGRIITILGILLGLKLRTTTIRH